MAQYTYANLVIRPGRPYPTGPVVYENGVRFAVFSRHATRVWLALFDHVEDGEPAREYAFDPEFHRTGDMWSIFVEGLGSGAFYMFRMDGPLDPEAGHRFNPNVYLLDPYAKAFVGDIHDGTMKCVTVHDEKDWSEDRPPRIPMPETVIYETHVKGLTAHASSGVDAPGTYTGFIDKIPYLKDLGVTAVELLPIHEFGETYLGRTSLITGEPLINYWGYSNIGFFAPAGRYAQSAVECEHLEEFRHMVHALHEAGMELILDVVFNHTSEGNELGPTLSFRGLDNTIYYILDEDGEYSNYSGCGNTVNCNHPLVRDFILDCLRYWVAVMHVDGFRFDLASILGRDVDGEVLEEAPLIRRIAEDPVLRNTKLIAEAWDAGGAYQVGSFGDVRWAEWNGRYRDDMRRYWRGDPAMRGPFATRLTGSSDLYEMAGRSPEHSINFVTCHDGFTLRDLVSYKEKRNWANGEGNRDGSNDNLSMNCGVEGDIDAVSEVNELRLRMQKNFIATLFLSLGVPMLLGGDEFGRTQLGNNNAYCQDNEISWHNWELLDEYDELHAFTRRVIAFRKENPVLRRRKHFTGELDPTTRSRDIAWFEPDGGKVDWVAPEGTLGCHIAAINGQSMELCMIFNNGSEAVDFTLPTGAWTVRIDTSRPGPRDVVLETNHAKPLADATFTLVPHSLAVFTSVPRPARA